MMDRVSGVVVTWLWVWMTRCFLKTAILSLSSRGNYCNVSIAIFEIGGGDFDVRGALTLKNRTAQNPVSKAKPEKGSEPVVLLRSSKRGFYVEQLCPRDLL